LSELSKPVRISVALGLIGGGYSAVLIGPIATFILSSQYVVTGDLAFTELTPIVAGIAAFIGSFVLLFRPLSTEKRGILGTLVLIGASAPFVMLLLSILSLAYPRIYGA